MQPPPNNLFMEFLILYDSILDLMDINTGNILVLPVILHTFVNFYGEQMSDFWLIKNIKTFYSFDLIFITVFLFP